MKYSTSETNSANGFLTTECPKCGTDSVIPDALGVPLSAEFLATMKKWWF